MRRRTFLGAGLSALAVGRLRVGAARASASDRKFTMDLTCGSIGVRADARQAIELAARFGFESVAPDAGFLGGLSDDQLAEVLAELKAKKLVWGAAGLPVEFRGDQAKFDEDMKGLAKTAKALERAGASRIGTWIRPAHEELTHAQNLKRHAERLRQAATVLGDHGVRLGLEYVGPKTSRANSPHSFVHNLAGMRELIAAIDRPNVGVVLDSWHWYTAGETVDDLRSLSNADVVACDLNDAPAGIDRDAQMDLKRELPCATGVIDLKAFLNALVAIGYDGPVRAEPFKAELRSMPSEEAVAMTAKAMKQAFALIG